MDGPQQKCLCSVGSSRKELWQMPVSGRIFSLSLSLLLPNLLQKYGWINWMKIIWCFGLKKGSIPNTKYSVPNTQHSKYQIHCPKYQVILWTKEGPKRLRFQAPDKTVTVKQVMSTFLLRTLSNVCENLQNWPT